jgi:hypothetical protein
MARLTALLLLTFLGITDILAQPTQQVRIERKFEREPDEAEWRAVSRKEFRYQNPQKEETSLFINTEAGWKQKNRDKYTYNNARKILSHDSYLFNEADNSVFLQSITENSYLNDTLLTYSLFTRKVFEESISTFQSDIQLEYTSDLQVSTRITRFKESVDGKWSGNKIDYFYDAKGCLTRTAYSQLTDAESWRLTRTEHITRDGNCRELEFTRFSHTGPDSLEVYARYSTYEESENVSRSSRYERFITDGAWQLVFDREIRRSQDSVIDITINEELAFTIRKTRIEVNGLLVTTSSEITSSSMEGFQEVSRSSYFYEGDLLTRIEWEERGSDIQNNEGGEGITSYKYDSKGRRISYQVESILNGKTSFYSEQSSFRCDEALQSVETRIRNSSEVRDAMTQYEYYSDPDCDGPDFDSAILLYPNPASDHLWVYSGQDLLNAQMRIIDLTGKIILKQVNSETSYTSLDISTLKEGMYILEIETEGYKKSARFVKYE